MKLKISELTGLDLPADALHRAERLAQGYLETEIVMREHDIQHTIVVFGGTRIADSEHLSNPDATDYYAIAREFGAIVGRSGQGPADCSLTLMTGGGPGIMEAANRGASEVGAKSIGLNIRLPHEQVPNRYITEGLSFNFRYFAIRKLHFLLRARALVVFPGGFGTMDELFETLNLVQCRRIDPLPVVLVGRQFWQRAVDLEFLATEGLIDAEDRSLYSYAETAEQVWHCIVDWYAEAGIPLLCEPL
ncbi:MAG: LOG family protein [Gammaproteobacteria bacterium]|nr:LOG family protein [Gammaproteobacteria bacterium]MBT8110541.1 LOG family protein [Gammaproteobacteria bacterium]NND47489.1 LOG family protein [Woeseiaceae bacterium]NNL45241.1 LOG family protein [Woeseiaceae bacterium]